MANIVKLNYTADEINERLGNIPSMAQEQQNIDEELSKVSTEIAVIVDKDGGNSADIWEQGAVETATGKLITSTLRLRTVNYLPSSIANIFSDYPYSFCLYAWDSAGTYIGVWDGTAFVKTKQTWLTSCDLSQMADFEYQYKLTFRRNNDAVITPESCTYIHFVNFIFEEIEAVRTEFIEKTDSLSSAVTGDMNNSALWANGGIKSTGEEYKSTSIVRTASYVPDGVKLIYSSGNYKFMAFLYDDSDTLVGCWGRTSVVQTADNWLFYLATEHLNDYKIRLIATRTDSSNITPNDVIDGVHFLNEIHAKAFYPTPTLTFIDDDGSLNALENWESITDEIGVKITSALVTGVMGDGETNPQKASWADVARLQNKGYEFVSHTHHHINIPQRTDDVVIEEFENSITALREHGCESRYLVYPYNAIDSAKMPLVKKYFSAAVGLGKETDNILPIQTHDLKRYSINNDELVEKEYNGATVQAHGFRTLDELKGYIDTALINGGWVIIMTHLRNDGEFYHDDASRTMIIDLCKYAVEKGVLIQTFGEAYRRYKNIMETGTINNSNYYITDCNGVVRYK